MTLILLLIVIKIGKILCLTAFSIRYKSWERATLSQGSQRIQGIQGIQGKGVSIFTNIITSI